jgi:hypothetical protein
VVDSCCDPSFGKPVLDDTSSLGNPVDPNNARLINIFDSHCHFDRVFNYWKRAQDDTPLASLTEHFPEAFGKKFEGCIAVNCDPRRWKVRRHRKNCKENRVRIENVLKLSIFK